MVGANETPITPGERIRAARRRRGLTVVQVAGLCGKSAGWLKKIESGERGLPRVQDLVRLCEVLGVDNLVDITGDTATRTLTSLGRPSHPSLPAIRAALTSFRLSETDAEPMPVDILRGRIDQAWHTWHTSATQRTDVGRVLPDLLIDAQRATRVHVDDEHRVAAHTVLADTYHLAQQMLAWLSEAELVWLSADRGMTAAQASGDRLAVAGASWCVGNLLRAVGRAEEAEDLVLEAAGSIERDSSPEHVAMRGALRLHAGLTAAREYSYGDAWHRWEAAAEDARRLGDYVHPWTVFGPGNLEVHAVSIDVELGRHREAIDRAERIDLSTLPSTERRARGLIEAGRAYAAEREDIAALHMFQRAEGESFETLRYAAPARHLIPAMVARSGSSTRAELVDMAARLEIPV